MNTNTVIAHYRGFHREHSERFKTIGEAFEFLMAGSERGEFSMGKIGLADGTVILSHEDLEQLRKLNRHDRAAKLGALDRSAPHPLEHRDAPRSA